MPCRDTRDFLSKIDSSREVHHVTVEVDPALEMAAIINRVSKFDGGGPALVFENVKGSQFRVAANLFGSESRVATALGFESIDGLSEWFADLIPRVDGNSALSRLSALPTIDSRVVLAEEAPCREVVHNCPNLGLIPVPKSWPDDGKPDHNGQFITLPLVITRAPEGGNQNCGMYRVAILGKDTVAIHWSPGSGGSLHASAWGSAGELMPVAIALGGPPALTFASILPLPVGVDEFGFAGLLQGEPVKVVKCLTSDLVVPAWAELVIEGLIEPGAVASDGAFGNHTGYYQQPASSPLVRVTAITHRKDMIYPTTLVGPPPMEDCCLASAAGRLLLALLKVDLPGIDSIHQPVAGIFHGGTIISAKGVSGKGLELLDRIRSISWLKESRLIILVDAEQDPADISGVYWRVLNNVSWDSDLRISGKSLGLDATAKPDGWHCGLEPVKPDQEILKLVEEKWRDYGFHDE